MPKINLPEKLIEAVKEYYEYTGDRRAGAVKWIENRHSRQTRTREYGKKTEGYRMLLVRVTNEDGEKESVLMETQNWADGHWTVTEAFFSPRECEEKLIRNFVESEEWL